MATYEGVILPELQPVEVQQKVFIGVKLPIANPDVQATLGQKIFNAENMELFIIGESGDGASKKTRILQGHTTWGEDNEKPRRYPLETSWMK